jgi:tetratricopeptide (TPR) repeat protein
MGAYIELYVGAYARLYMEVHARPYMGLRLRFYLANRVDRFLFSNFLSLNFFSLFLPFVITVLVSCHSTVIPPSAVLDKDSLEIDSFLPMEARVLRLINASEYRKLRNEELTEAFLLAEDSFYEKDYETREKMYSLVFTHEPSLTTGIKLAQTRIALGKLKEAEHTARKLSVLYPETSSSHILLSSIFTLKGESENALRILEKSYQSFPNDEGIVLRYALVLIQKGDSLGALQVTQKFLSQNPPSAPLLLHAAKLHIQNNEPQQGKKYLLDLLKLNADQIDALSMLADLSLDRKNYTEAEQYYAQILERDPTHWTTIQNCLHIFMQAKKYTHAQNILLKAESVSDSSNPLPYEFKLQLAKLFFLNKQYDTAQLRFESLYIENKDKNELSYYIGLCQEGMKNYFLAAQTLSIVHPSSGLYDEAFKRSIVNLINSGDFASVQARLDFLVQKEHKNQDEYVFLSSVYVLLRRYKEAIQCVSEGLKIYPEGKELLLKQALYLEYTHSKEASLGAIKSLIEKHPNYGEALNWYGYSLIQQKHHLPYAISLLKRAIHTDPENPFYLDSLGWAYFRAKQDKMALKFITQAHDLEPEEPVILSHLAELYTSRKSLTLALQTLQKLKTVLDYLSPFRIESDPELKWITEDLNHRMEHLAWEREKFWMARGKKAPML